MPIFHYKAYDNLGKEVSGVIEASGAKDAAARLKQDGLYPRDVSLEAKKRELFAWLKSLRPRGGSVDLASASRQLSTLLSSGASLHESLEIIIKEWEDTSFMANFMDVKERLAGGSSFARALEAQGGAFPEMYCRMVEAGEETGTLDSVMTRLADYLEARDRVYEKVKTALIYPILMTIVGLAVLSFLVIFVIPKITTIFKDTDTALPLITVILLGITSFVRKFWPLIPVFAVALPWGISRYLKRPRGKALKDRLIIKIPVIGKTIKKFYLFTMTRTLGSLLSSGVPLLRALDMTGKVVNHTLFQGVFDKAVRDVTEGGDLSKSLSSSKLLPGMIVYMTSIGEKSGQLPEMLLKVAESYEREFNTSVERGLALMEPVLILLMGAAVGFIVIAILLPIFELNQIVK